MNLYQSLRILILNQVYEEFEALSKELKQVAMEATNLDTRDLMDSLCLNIKCIQNDNRKFLLAKKSVDETKKEIVIEYNSILNKLSMVQFDLTDPYDNLKINNIKYQFKNSAIMHGIPCLVQPKSKIKSR